MAVPSVLWQPRQEKYRDPFAPLLPGVSFVAFNDTVDLKQPIDDSVCGVGLDTIQGEGDIRRLIPESCKLRGS